jgi:hypothetical protein
MLHVEIAHTLLEIVMFRLSFRFALSPLPAIAASLLLTGSPSNAVAGGQLLRRQGRLRSSRIGLPE